MLKNKYWTFIENDATNYHYLHLLYRNSVLEVAKHIIEGCKAADQKCCKQLYSMFKDKMYGVCLRYAESEHDANDIFQEGVIPVLPTRRNFPTEVNRP